MRHGENGNSAVIGANCGREHRPIVSRGAKEGGYRFLFDRGVSLGRLSRAEAVPQLFANDEQLFTGRQKDENTVYGGCCGQQFKVEMRQSHASALATRMATIAEPKPTDLVVAAPLAGVAVASSPPAVPFVEPVAFCVRTVGGT